MRSCRRKFATRNFRRFLTCWWWEGKRRRRGRCLCAIAARATLGRDRLMSSLVHWPRKSRKRDLASAEYEDAALPAQSGTQTPQKRAATLLSLGNLQLRRAWGRY